MEESGSASRVDLTDYVRGDPEFKNLFSLEKMEQFMRIDTIQSFFDRVHFERLAFSSSFSSSV